MSSSTTTISFSSIDYKGVNSLSSYALGLTPLTFIPDTADLALSADNSRRIVWDFGDGTLAKSFSASKAYKFPGIYDVNMIVYDCNNNAMISTETRVITIYNYTPFTFNIKAYGRTLTEDGSYIISEDGAYILSQVNSFDLKCGEIDGPFTFEASYPPYQTTSNIFYEVSGSGSNNYWKIKDNKFFHLDNYHTLYGKEYNFSLSADQFVEIDRVEFKPSYIYANVVDGVLSKCKSGDVGAVCVGSVGSKDVYLKDDVIKSDVIWNFYFDKTNNVLPFYTGDTNHLNNLSIQTKINIVNNYPDKLSITSNGLDGEGYEVKSFDINPIKFFNTKIPFVIKIKDVQNFSIKNFDKIQLSAVSISLYSIGDIAITTENGELLLNENGEFIYANGVSYQLDTSNYSISSLNYTLSSQHSGGSLRGYVEFFSATPSEFLSNVYMSISGLFTSDQSLTYSLSGKSSYFNVYPTDYFDLYKNKEDFNPSQTLKDLRFQETLLDKDMLFNNFIGGILGDHDSDHDGIGLKCYEKIANFTQNTQDVDNCEEGFLESLGMFVNYNNINEENYQYPEKIKRIINLASIDKSKLLGASNKFRENLDTRGRAENNVYGVNTGRKINTLQYTVSAGVPIIALEKFSNTYTLLNTHQPVLEVGSLTYPLSAYNSNFGWPLVLPRDFTYKDFDKYYIFFEYVDGYNNSMIGGVVDYTNSKTTIDSGSSSVELFGEDGIFENMFLSTMYQSLSLVK